MQPDHREHLQRSGAVAAGGELGDRGLQQGARLFGFSGVEQVPGKQHAPLWAVATKVDRHPEQLRGRGGSTAQPGCLGGAVECGERAGVGMDGGQGEVAGPLFRLIDGRGEPPMQCPPIGRAHASFDARGQQRMGEPHALPVDAHHTRALGGLQPHHHVCVANNPPDQVDGGFSGRRDGEQGRAHSVVQTGEPGLHERSEGARQPIGRGGAGQLQRVERVAARHLRDADQLAARDRPAGPGHQHLMQRAKTQRHQLPARRLDGLRKTQPGRIATSWCGAHGHEHSAGHR